MSRTCHDIFVRLSEYLDGNLSTRVYKEIQQHLAVCPECRAFSNTLRKTIELCRRLPHAPVPSELSRWLQAMVHFRFAHDRAGPPPRRGR
jgi:anti-sigma factor RsiW